MPSLTCHLSVLRAGKHLQRAIAWDTHPRDQPRKRSRRQRALQQLVAHQEEEARLGLLQGKEVTRTKKQQSEEEYALKTAQKSH